MAAVAPGIIFIWTGTNGTIPTGWVRETDLDGRYPKATAAGVNPNVTGGSNTHSHTSPSHTHTRQAHTHTGSTTRDGAFETEGGPNFDVSRDSHYHDYTTSTTSGGHLVNAISYQAVNSEPLYHEVIYIKPDGSPTSFKDGMVGLWNKASAPVGFSHCDGTGGTPDLRNKYLKGAGTGADAGGTGGGTNHDHTIDHTHTAQSHGHSATSGYDSDFGSRGRNTSGLGGPATPRHTHVVSLASNSAETGSAYTGTAGSAETIEVAYKKVAAVKNTSGGSLNIPKGLIALWTGSLSAIPSHWRLCDGTKNTPDLRSKFIKIISTTSELGNSGGSNTHSHAASNSHTHTAAGTHTHGGVTDGQAPVGSTGAGSDGVAQGHSHTVDTCSSSTTTWAATTVSANSSDHQPAYRTVAYIMYAGKKGGLFLFNYI